MVEKNADSFGIPLLNWDDRLQKCSGISDQTELPFMCLQHGMEEAAKHPVPDGKYVKVQCIHKSVPRIIEWSPRGRAFSS
jgi:hypothetical protein